MIEFNEELHQYTINGKIIPSVSEIIKRILPGQYDSIPEWILQRAAEFGTDVHSMIEVYNVHGMYLPAEDERKNHCLDEWIKLKDGIEITSSEMMVNYKDIYCGTFDALAKIDGQTVLMDYKTTSKVHTEHLTLQLNLYRLAYENLTGERVDRLIGVWLPKTGEGKLVECDLIPDEELMGMISARNIDETEEFYIG